MFTGIVSAVGRVAEVGANRLVISQPAIVSQLGLGGSVAVNGCCLTVTAIDGDSFAADVVPESLRRTNLGALEPGSAVNLELPLVLGASIDGHLVQGHVDGTAAVLQLSEVESGRELTIELPQELARYVAEKGSIAVDGMSLTVARVLTGAFLVALIPHTLAVSVAGEYAQGTRVNLEVDQMARYAERLLGLGRT